MSGVSRFGWVAVSQAASSASNVVVVLAAAAGGDASIVGAVTLLGAVYLVTLCLVRGLVGDPLLLGVRRDDTTVGTVVGIASVLGLTAGAGLALVIAPLLGSDALAAYMVGLMLCPLLTQDALRYVAFSRGRADLAAWSDIAWAIVATVLAAALLAAQQLTTAGLFLAWCVGGTAAGGWLAWRLGVAPRLSAPWQLLKSDFSLRLSLLADGLLTVGAVQAALVLTALVAGTAAAGNVRFLQALFGPATILFMALYISSAQPGGHRDARRTARTMSLKLGLTTLGFGGVFWALPASVGHIIAGETFTEAQTLLWPFTLAQLLAGLGTSAMTGLRLAGRAPEAARVRGVWAVLLLAGTWFGGSAGGARGVLLGTGVANAAGAALWWLALTRTGPDTSGMYNPDESIRRTNT